MAPVAILAAWYGGIYFVALATLAGVGMAWEWTRLTQGAVTAGGGILMLGAALVPVTGWGDPMRGAALIVAIGALSCLPPVRARPRWWMGAGALYIMLPQLALIVIREQGRWLLLWVLFLVWATDSAAYFAGRLIGGPKLAPRLSPKKTWAGLAGGMLGAAMVGWFLRQGAMPGALHLAALSAGFAVLAQAGDLAESGLKRYFGVKDSSRLIPGHGGVLDRLDGLLAVAPAVAAMTLLWPGGWDIFNGW